MSSSERSESGAGRFLLTVAATAFLVIGALLGWTWFGDPTGLLRQTYGGTKRCPAGAMDVVQLMSPELAQSVRWPAVVRLGTSRVDIGFEGVDPEPLGNLGLASTSVHEIVTLGRNAIRSGQVREIRIGLEFAQFTDPALVSHRTPKRDWLARQFPILRQGLLNDRTIIDAFKGCPEAPSPPQPRQIAETELLRFFAARLPTTPHDAESRFYASGMDTLGTLLAEARTRNVKVRLWTGPNRSPYLKAVAAAGQLPLFKQWHTDLDRLATTHGAMLLHLEGDALRQNDPALACPNAPALDCHFSDATHYTSAIGRAIDAILVHADDPKLN